LWKRNDLLEEVGGGEGCDESWDLVGELRKPRIHLPSESVLQPYRKPLDDSVDDPVGGIGVGVGEEGVARGEG